MLFGDRTCQHDAINPERHGREDVGTPTLIDDLKWDLTSEQVHRTAKRNGSKTHQREEGGHDGCQAVQKPVSFSRDEVFLDEHLQAVGQNLEQAEHPEAENGGSVGTDAILHHCTLLAFHPGQDGCKVEHADEHGENFG